METEGTSLNYFYHILVKVGHDHSSTEWHGYLTLYPQENGEIFVDLSFSDQPVVQLSQDQSWDYGISGLFIQCIAQKTLCEPIHEDNTGEFEQHIYHPIGLSINSYVDQED